MKSIFSRFFSSFTPPPPVSTLIPNPPKEAAPGIEEGSDTAVRRQLVQVLTRDLMRKQGLPSDWIECRLLVVNTTSKGAGLYVHLVLKHWDQRLINHTLAFQNTLLQDISRFEPRASDWLHGISWQMEFGDQCPHTTLPGRGFWEAEAPAPAASNAPVCATLSAARVALERGPDFAATQPFSAPHAAILVRSAEEQTQEDLQELFKVRDQAMAQFSHPPVGYETTQPASL